MNFLFAAFSAPLSVSLSSAASSIFDGLDIDIDSLMSKDSQSIPNRLGAHTSGDGAYYEIDTALGKVTAHSYIGDYVVIDTYLDRPERVAELLETAKSRFADKTAVGLDFEFGGSAHDASDKFIALVQIATPDFVMLLRTGPPESHTTDDARFSTTKVPWQSGLPAWIRELLVNPHVKKAAVGFIGEDMKYLKLFDIEMTELSAENFGIVDLQKELARRLVHVTKPPSFESLANHFGLYPAKEQYKLLHKAFERFSSVPMKDWFKWDSPKMLPELLIRYAAEDAWFALLIYEFLNNAASSELADLSVDQFMVNMHPPLPGQPILIEGQSVASREKQRRDNELQHKARLNSKCEKLVSVYEPFGTHGQLVTADDPNMCYIKLCTSRCADFEIPPSWASGLGKVSDRLEYFKELTEQAKSRLCSDGPSDSLCSDRWDVESFIASILPRTLSLQKVSIAENGSEGTFQCCAAADEAKCASWSGGLAGLAKAAIAQRSPTIQRYVDEKMKPIFESITDKIGVVPDENAGSVVARRAFPPDRKVLGKRE